MSRLELSQSETHDEDDKEKEGLTVCVLDSSAKEKENNSNDKLFSIVCKTILAICGIFAAVTPVQYTLNKDKWSIDCVALLIIAVSLLSLVNWKNGREYMIKLFSDDEYKTLGMYYDACILLNL